MRILVQRVVKGQVTVDQKIIGQVGRGFVLLVGVHKDDTEEVLNYMVDKIVNLRVFEDQEGKFNLSLLDVKGELLIVSQFTLYADCSKGRRPSFVDAAAPETANQRYIELVEKFRASGVKVETGQFQAHMQVDLVNDGPVTIMLER